MKNTVYLFDVDGVLTDPLQKKVTNFKTIEIICNLLEKDILVGLNTGRSKVFVENEIIKFVVSTIKDKSKLINLFGSCEKGAITITFDNVGNQNVFIDKNISVPENIKDEIRALIKNKYSHLVFYDETKLSMVSAEMKNGMPLEYFWQEQKNLDDDMDKILLDNKLQEIFKIDPSRIATDLESKYVGKDLGVENFIKWCKENNKTVDEIIFFGDSKSDLKMVEGAINNKKTFEFVFVGKQDYLKDVNINFPIIFTKKLYEEGVVEYFFKNKF